jgi:hypothetical protein
MLTGPDFIEFVTRKLEEHGVEKVIPDDETLAAAWTRAHLAIAINALIRSTWGNDDGASYEDAEEQRFLQESPVPPADLADRVRRELESDPIQSWDEALWSMAGGGDDEDDEDDA